MSHPGRPPAARSAVHGPRGWAPRARFNVCFHGIGRPEHEREHGEAGYWITEDNFLTLLDWLAAVPEVSLSFDDGNRSDVEIALGALRDRGLTATFFPVVGWLGDPWSVTPADLHELVAAGMEVGSHGQDHLPWAGMRGRAAEEEMVRPRETLEDLLGRRVDKVAVPMGRYDRRSLALLRAHGCAEVNVSDERPARTGAWLQPRFSVRADDTVDRLRERLLASLSPARAVRNRVAATAKRWR